MAVLKRGTLIQGSVAIATIVGLLGFSTSDVGGYQPAEEVAAWKPRCARVGPR